MHQLPRHRNRELRMIPRTERRAFLALFQGYRREGFTPAQALWNALNDRDNDNRDWRRYYAR